jgi:hypothetical protein
MKIFNDGEKFTLYNNDKEYGVLTTYTGLYPCVITRMDRLKSKINKKLIKVDYNNTLRLSLGYLKSKK